MENLGGALGFRATLDIDDFNVSAHAMERQIRVFSSSAINEVADVEVAVQRMAQKAGEYISYYLVGQGMYGFVNSIIQTRGQFQQLEIAFETMLGSGSKANALMQQMISTAAKTPFDLMGVAEGAKQLMAYGVSADKVNDTLVRLGNIASGLSIPLNDIVYLYGTTMVQGRLYAQDVRQFTGRGIPLVKELAEKYHKTTDEINAMVSAGKVGFKDVEEVLNKMTNAGGQFYNLMEKQSASLTGQIANLEDAWDTVLNDFGKSGQDLFAAGISGATYFVEHMDDVLRIVKAITIAYGSYKAAMILTSVAMKGQTGIAVLDNTVRAAKMALLQKETILNGKLAVSQNAVTVSDQATTAALEAMLSAEERDNVVKQLRLGAITSLLTAQQQEYLSTMGLTTASAGYEAAAIGVMNADQRAALSKINLTTQSAAYRAALTQEVASKRANQAATLESMRLSVKEAAVKAEATRMDAIKAKSALEAAQMELYRAQTTSGVDAYLIAQKKLEAAEDNAALTRKVALAAQADFYAKKKALETAATQASRSASQADTAAKTAQAASTNFLALATNKLTGMFKALWATLRANPLGWLLTIAGTIYSVITMLSSKTDENNDTMSEFGDETKKVISQLNLYFSVLQNTDKETKTHKDALEKINALCQEYNKTLLDENATLDIQKLKYQELTKAIQETTAQKILAKKAEEAGEKLSNKNDENYERWAGWTENATYWKATSKDGKSGYQTAAENIRKMSDEVKQATRELVQESAQELARMSQTKFDEEFPKKLNRITNAIQKAANITEAEMPTVRRQIDQYLKYSISGYKEMDATIANSKKILDDYYRVAAETPVAPSTDYAKMSFEDLDKLVVDTQKEIDAINAKKVKVDTDNTKLDELLSKLLNIKKVISNKDADLNTEEGISNRIKQLKEERAQTVINSARYKDLNKEILQLEGRLPQHKSAASLTSTAKTAERNAETLRQKQLEAETRLEEARISAMEEGYEKRKATLDLQHKEALDRIDKEERELIAARKKANKGGLTQEEQNGFNQRRDYENQSYQQSTNKLFEGELEYKKKQYELYWRWVENMGKDVADKQFASLLQSGSSFKDYIEKQRADLQAKKAAGTLTEGEGNFLISLNVQYDELTGAKTALEAFKEQVDQSIGRAQTLADKIDAIAKAKEQLENGTSGIINDDDRAAAALDLERRSLELQRELRETVLSDYRTYEEQKDGIIRKHILLREEVERQAAEDRRKAEETGNKDQLEVIERTRVERLNLIKRSETEELSTLNTSFLQQSDSWKKLFSDLDTLSVGQISKLVKDVESQLAAGNLKLSPVDYKAVIDSLTRAKERIQQLNPFSALDTFFNDYLKARKKLAAAKAALAKGEGSKEDVENAEREVKAAANGITQSVEKVTDITTECASSLQSMFDALGMDGVADGLGTAIELMGQLGNAAASVGKFMSGDIIGGVTGMISSITSVVGIFPKLHDKKYEKRIQELQKQIDALERSYSRLERAFNNTYWVFNDEERAGFEQNIKLIEDQIAALEKQRETARRAWDFAKHAQLTAQIKDLNKQLSKAKEGDDMLGLYEQQKQSLREQQELMRQQIQAEKDKKKTDNNKIQQWNDAIEQIEQQIEDLDRQMMETFAGTTTKEAIDQYADAIVDAYCAGEDAAKALGDTTREVLKKAVIDALKRQFLAKAMDEAVQHLSEAMSDGVLTKEEKARFEYLTRMAGETFTNALDAVGDWIKDIEDDTASDPLAGAVAAMSEETGGVIAGRLNAFIINQSEQTSVLREQLLQQSAISQNTANTNAILSRIDATLKRIETKDSSLLSQGIS